MALDGYVWIEDSRINQNKSQCEITLIGKISEQIKLWNLDDH